MRRVRVHPTPQTHRDMHDEFTDVQADAKLLVKAASRSSGSSGSASQVLVAVKAAATAADNDDAAEFLNVLLTRNERHLSRVFEAQTEQSSVCMVNLVKKRFNGGGPMQQLLIALVEHIESPGTYYAKLLKVAVQGAGMDEGTIIWFDSRLMVVVSPFAVPDLRHLSLPDPDKVHRLLLRIRGTPALEQTKEAFEKLTPGKTLVDRLRSETTGHHQALVVALLNQSSSD